MFNINFNPGIQYEELLCEETCINMPAIERSISNMYCQIGYSDLSKIGSLLRAVTCIDLTTLCGDDSQSNVERLCHKALNPLDSSIVQSIGLDTGFHVGAVCVYPAQVNVCKNVFERVKSVVPIASVAAGFPSGQYHLKSKLEEIKSCIGDGASEIDIVISRDLVLRGEFKELYNEIRQMKNACGKKAILKTIIAAGELGSLHNVYKASMISMAAGSDFIKTSTGKESVNATLPIGMTMARAICDFHDFTGIKVGFKPAGGIRSVDDVLLWQTLMRIELGPDWLFPNLFRIGASGLLGAIEHCIYQYVNDCQPVKHMFSYQ